MKKISLADLLVTIKQYKGLVAAWTKRLEKSSEILVETSEEYTDQSDYTFAECLEQLTKTKEYLNYLKNLRNDKSQEQIKISYQIGELKDFNSTLEKLNFRKVGSKRVKDEYVNFNAYLPISKKELDNMIITNQAKVNDLQSRITQYNNNTFLDVEDYKA